jgi:predicted nuclease of predicted toxin-antitoxin system
MRFLADENVPGPVVGALRGRGHDVVWIKELMPGAEDAVVLELAQSERRVVVTADTDFGELTRMATKNQASPADEIRPEYAA